MVYDNLDNINLLTYRYKIKSLGLRDIIKSTSYTSRLGNNVELDYKDKGKFLLISYVPPHHGFLPKNQLVPAFIPLNEETLEIFGLLQGEGLKKGSEDFQFCNTTPNLIEAFLSYFERCWYIKREKWNVIIEFRLPQLTKAVEKSLLKFWQKYGPFNSIKIMHRKSLLSTLASKKGNLLIRIHSSILHSLINSILDKIKKLAEEKPAYAIPYLKGLLASDGYIKLRNNSISKVCIVTSDRIVADHYQSIFSNLSIKSKIESSYTLIIISKKKDIIKYETIIDFYNILPIKKNISRNEIEIRIYNKSKEAIEGIYNKIIELSDKPLKILKKSKYDVFICGWNNFFRLFYLTKTPFGKHTQRNKKFIVGLFNHKRTKMISRFSFLQEIFSIKDYQNKFGVNRSTVYSILNTYQKYGIIKKTAWGKYSLSEKGKLIVDTFKEVSQCT